MPWFPYGPDGGDARAFAVDPKDATHIYLGSANGWIYESRNEGQVWTRLARIDRRDDLVVDNILVDGLDARHLIVGAWALGGHADGGIFMSADGGASWTAQPEMRGQSVLSLTSSPSEPKTLVAGTLAGVFRSVDSGAHWEAISPAGDKQIHEVESLAVDPLNPQIIYAGTWHLPWKTVDGGATWAPISKGIIEDSDVFSIIVDPKQPNVVYASACSGIYKSDDAGAKFIGGVTVNKAQGIPLSARRTRVLMQDPSHPDTVYAGTTEGLWRTDNAGQTWVRKSGPDVIVNDVYVDPHDSQRVLLATDRGGVLSSGDGGESFHDSSNGFSARQVTAYVADSKNRSRVYVGVVNDKALGGVFMSDAAGLSWTQESQGLGGRDVFALGQAPDGSVLAGTAHGIYRLTASQWVRTSVEATSAASSSPAGGTHTVKGAETPAKTTRPRSTALQGRATRTGRVKHETSEVKQFDGSVYAFALSGETLYAGSSRGLFRSSTNGVSWTQVDGVPLTDWRLVAAAKGTVVLANLDTVMLSTDGGMGWDVMKTPSQIAQVLAAAVDGNGTVWLGGREGVYYTKNRGADWQTRSDLYVRNVNSLFFDEEGDRVLVTSNGPATVAFAVQLPSMKVSYWDTGWNLRFVRPMGDHLLAGTMFDGIVIQPRMIDSSEAAAH